MISIDKNYYFFLLTMIPYKMHIVVSKDLKYWGGGGGGIFNFSQIMARGLFIFVLLITLVCKQQPDLLHKYIVDLVKCSSTLIQSY